MNREIASLPPSIFILYFILSYVLRSHCNLLETEEEHKTKSKAEGAKSNKPYHTSVLAPLAQINKNVSETVSALILILSSWVKFQGRMLLPQDHRALGTRECHTFAVIIPAPDLS